MSNRRPLLCRASSVLSFIVLRIGRQILQFVHKVADYAVSTQGVVLIKHVAHYLPVADREIAFANVPFVSFVKPVSQKRYHRPSKRLLVFGVFLRVLCLPPVLPCNHAQRQHAHLLYPVFAHDLANRLPAHSSPPLKRAPMRRPSCSMEPPAPMNSRCDTTPYTAPMRSRCGTIPSHERMSP